jgi:hypothetical protein
MVLPGRSRAETGVNQVRPRIMPGVARFRRLLGRLLGPRRPSRLERLLADFNREIEAERQIGRIREAGYAVFRKKDEDEGVA